MPMNNFSVGRDLTLVIVGRSGTVQAFPLMKKFDAKQETVSVKIRAISGAVYHLEIPDGWKGSMEFERQGELIDSYFSSLESDYYAGVNIGNAYLTETVTEPDGSTSQWRYTNVVFKYSDAGMWESDKAVTIKMDWSASQRLQLS
jgi:hypothetical protein